MLRIYFVHLGARCLLSRVIKGIRLLRLIKLTPHLSCSALLLFLYLFFFEQISDTKYHSKIKNKKKSETKFVYDSACFHVYNIICFHVVDS